MARLIALRYLGSLLLAGGCTSSPSSNLSAANTGDPVTLHDDAERATTPLEAQLPLLRRTPVTLMELDPAVTPGFESAMIETTEEHVSSFALDANTASYSLARTALMRGELPDPASIRTEEFVHRFEYRDREPEQRDFSITVEAIASPYRPDYDILRFGVRARDMAPFEREPMFLVFVIDASSSMDKNGHLNLIQDGLRTLAQRLGSEDRVGLIAYGHRAKVTLQPTAGSHRAEILTAIDQLRSEGVSNLDAGLALASEVLSTSQGPPLRRIVVCSDGVPNAGSLVAAQLMTRVSDIAKRGVTVSTVGIGLGNYSDALMEQLSAEGQGLHAYVDRREEVRRAFAENLSGTPQVVARYAKLEIEFDPQRIARFRRLGYERSRGGSDTSEVEDHTGGAIGAGHSVTALYEVQQHATFGPNVSSNPILGTVRIRYHDTEDRVRILEQPFTRYTVQPSTSAAASRTQLALVAAVFAEKLRNSYWALPLRWSDLQTMHSELPASVRRWRDVAELGELIAIAAERTQSTPPTPARFVFDRLTVLK